MEYDDSYVELIGRSGKIVTKSIYDIDFNERVVFDKYQKFYAYISRWYRLPGVYNTEYEALKAILEFRKKYQV